MYILRPFIDEVLSEEIVKKDNEMGGNIPGGNFPGRIFLEPIIGYSVLYY